MDPINVSVFLQDEKTGNQPDFTGTSRDKKSKGAAWIKESTKNVGEIYYSVKVTDDKNESFNISTFKNEKTKDNQPDFTGTSRDKKVRAAIWEKDDKNRPGKKYLSIKVSEYTPRPA